MNRVAPWTVAFLLLALLGGIAWMVLGPKNVESPDGALHQASEEAVNKGQQNPENRQYASSAQGGTVADLWHTPCGTFRLVLEDDSLSSLSGDSVETIFSDIQLVHKRLRECELVPTSDIESIQLDGVSVTPTFLLKWKPPMGRPKVFSHVTDVVEVLGEQQVVVPRVVAEAYQQAFALVRENAQAVAIAETFREQFNSQRLAELPDEELRTHFYVLGPDGLVPAPEELSTGAAQNLRSESPALTLERPSLLDFDEVVLGKDKILAWHAVYSDGETVHETPQLAYVSGKWNFVVVP